MATARALTEIDPNKVTAIPLPGTKSATMTSSAATKKPSKRKSDALEPDNENNGGGGGSSAPKPKATKKAKTDPMEGLSVDDIHLEGEATCDVPVYDTCGEMRRKIQAFLKRKDMTQAAFLREIAKTFPDGRKLQANQLRRFLKESGPRGGISNPVFYAAYVFFEKLRIKEGKPKSMLREETEKAWDEHRKDGGRGMDREHGGNQYYTCLADENIVVDKYGIVRFEKSYRGTAGARCVRY